MNKTAIDGDGQPLAKGINWKKNQIKAVNTLYGLCMGMLSDGEINDREILFLEVWLKENRQSQSVFKCVVCGHVENADINAAQNILAAGHVVLACGETINPKLVLAVSMKQEPTERAA